MTDEFDWADAEEALYRISKDQFTGFLRRTDRGDLYGLGFFCDPIEGVMPVANSRSFHDASFRQYVERGGTTDEGTFKWDIGNWEYPAGLASSTEEQMEFNARWEGFRGLLSQSDDDRTQEMLEDHCIRVLRRLCDEGVFSDARDIEGLIVLGPDDRAEDVLAKKGRLDGILDRPT
jgi:hypothetical protein